MVGSVQPHVDERRGRAEHARQAGAAHHAVGGPAALEQGEHPLVVPAGVPELHRDAHPRRQAREQVVQPGVIAGVGRVQLQQQHRP